MSYQNVTGPLMANSHPGSYCGQDAYSDMLVTDYDSGLRRQRTNESKHWRTGGCAELYARPASNFSRGGTENLETVVRRLSPTECSRLQGYPDGWVDIGDWVDTKGKTHKDSDSAKYKALGNSICLPFWKWLARRISAQYERDITMGSLFAGIGGFELVFKQVGGYPLWESEVEEFCVAVLKKHFGDEESGTKGDWNEYIS